MLDSVPLSNAFLVYAGLVATLVAMALSWTFQGRGRALALVVLVAWISYASAFSWFGLLGDLSLRPPGVVLLVGPIFIVLGLTVGASPVGHMIAAGLPLWLLIGFQSFRVGVELTIAALHRQGLAPALMTLEGGNFEFLVALSAPPIAWIATRGAAGRGVALIWSVLGVLSILNVATRAALSAPGPLNFIHAEFPNLAFASFPFGLIPGFMAPLALATHLLTFRALRV